MTTAATVAAEQINADPQTSHPQPNGIALPMTEFEEMRQKAKEMAQANALAKFDYRANKGNKLARSHVAKLRVFKADINRARVAAKAEAIAYGKRVDSVAADLTKLVEDMIKVHEAPLLAIETEEKERKERLENQLTELRKLALGVDPINGVPLITSSDLEVSLRAVNDVSPESFGDAAQQVADASAFAIAQLSERIARAKQAEADAAELVRLRAEQVAREKREKEEAAARVEKERQEQAERDRLAKIEADRLATIAREEQIRQKAAAAEAKRLADEIAAKERAAQEEREAADRREQEARDRVAAAEKAKAEAEERARIAEAQAKEREQAAARAKAEEEARERKASENKARRKKVHLEVMHDLCEQSLNAAQADMGKDQFLAVLGAMIDAIAAGKVRHLSITYTDAP